MASMRPLDGIRVVGLTNAIAGPMTCHILAEYGAEVIKVESNTRPDGLRLSAPFAGGVAHVDRGGRFAPYSGSVLSMAVNLNHPGGPAFVKRLVSRSDVLVENFAPGVLAKHGLSFDSFVAERPDLVMLSLSIFGLTGPNSALPGLGTDLAALTGFASMTGWPDRGPSLPQGAYTDFIIPPLAACAILAALEHREATGQGLYIDLAEYEAALWFLLPQLLDSAANGRAPSRPGNRMARGAPHQLFRCGGDDRWCAIAIADDEQWRTLCRLIGRPELGDDPRFATYPARIAYNAELTAVVEAWTEQRSPHEVMDLLQRHGLEAGAAQSAEDLHEDPQLAHRGHFRLLDHPEMGASYYQALPIRLPEIEPQWKPAPCLGEHTYDICHRVLGLSDEEIVQFIDDNVLY
ncbi:MAG: CoA transferase [Chloroflexota bacterium]|nr:MAG: CoA transferase [Chloroflexota bacterium]